MSMTTIEVPSKCRFELLDTTLESIEKGDTTEDLAREIGEHPRQAHFLIQNARILGFAKKVKRGYSLTEKGRSYLKASETEKGYMLSYALLECRIIDSLVQYAGSLGKAVKMSREEISDFLVRHVSVPTSGHLMQRVTADRRASTVRAWLDWLRCNSPSVE